MDDNFLERFRPRPIVAFGQGRARLEVATHLPWRQGYAERCGYALRLAPRDLSETDGWTLNKHASVAYTADPFSGAGQSLQLAKGAEAATPASSQRSSTARSS